MGTDHPDRRNRRPADIAPPWIRRSRSAALPLAVPLLAAQQECHPAALRYGAYEGRLMLDRETADRRQRFHKDLRHLPALKIAAGEREGANSCGHEDRALDGAPANSAVLGQHDPSLPASAL